MSSIDIALMCRALSDSTRLEIIQMLNDGEKCACKILEKFSITQPTLSYHMKILTDCGLVLTRKESKWINYSLDKKKLKTFQKEINALTDKK
ncbi:MULTISPECIES: ArsR/SmtB family transcription factor [Treponema]|jgi:Predicted transcriptional regulators|uniref:ArsR/SmtB family transcription factor n=1 Tax=Treponema TaxID=157 RepID=UPI0002B53FC8|nr:MULTISPECIES: metalloregulator ArsR/SmtB family transcription factor [Treponema]EMB42356.1 hypothetical protein HMPREF9729_02380 [Treponema denticola ASLM]EMD56455.1 hypothetical protein HMPREF9728_01571 [Treponema denticola US-Trep]UTC68034.1 winged helix-turn-helix transcriptional regulator [Treponema sp. OMZ 789]UTC70756.1 winged helix-turn-helix transcriptional regulator [Treponema sp. OMZ 790]UTC73476.1 winged helix-turn-helix transcriptional regulator [Treponema sp. OMZ 791]